MRLSSHSRQPLPFTRGMTSTCVEAPRVVSDMELIYPVSVPRYQALT